MHRTGRGHLLAHESYAHAENPSVRVAVERGAALVQHLRVWRRGISAVCADDEMGVGK